MSLGVDGGLRTNNYSREKDEVSERASGMRSLRTTVLALFGGAMVVAVRGPEVKEETDDERRRRGMHTI